MVFFSQWPATALKHYPRAQFVIDLPAFDQEKAAEYESVADSDDARDDDNDHDQTWIRDDPRNDGNYEPSVPGKSDSSDLELSETLIQKTVLEGLGSETDHLELQVTRSLSKIISCNPNYLLEAKKKKQQTGKLKPSVRTSQAPT